MFIKPALTLVYRLWLPLTCVLWACITALSLSPLSELPEVPGSDKTHHVIAYCVLVIPVVLRKPRYWLVVVAGFVVWSGAIELIQPYVNRYGEWLDMAANVTGLMAGSILAIQLRRFIDVSPS